MPSSPPPRQDLNRILSGTEQELRTDVQDRTPLPQPAMPAERTGFYKDFLNQIDLERAVCSIEGDLVTEGGCVCGKGKVLTPSACCATARTSRTF